MRARRSASMQVRLEAAGGQRERCGHADCRQARSASSWQTVHTANAAACTARVSSAAANASGACRSAQRLHGSIAGAVARAQARGPSPSGGPRFTPGRAVITALVRSSHRSGSPSPSCWSSTHRRRPQGETQPHMRLHMHDRTHMYVLRCMLTFTLTLSTRPANCLHTFTIALPTQDHFGRQFVDEALCCDRSDHGRDGYDRCGYDRWSLRGTSSQAPCPGLGPAEERARAPSPATLVAA